MRTERVEVGEETGRALNVKVCTRTEAICARSGARAAREPDEAAGHLLDCFADLAVAGLFESWEQAGMTERNPTLPWLEDRMTISEKAMVANDIMGLCAGVPEQDAAAELGLPDPTEAASSTGSALPTG